MPKQDAPSTVAALAAEQPCCPPLAGGRLPAETAAALAPVFKALGDPIRLQLMSMIASAPSGEICVCDLTSAFDVTGPTISYHLRALREAGLISGDRRGTWVYYRADPRVLDLLGGLLTRTSPADR